MTFARNLGPFDDGLQRGVCVTHQFRDGAVAFSEFALNREKSIRAFTRRHLRDISRAGAKKRTNFTLRPASLLCRFIRLLPCSRLPLLKLRSRSRTSTNACVNLKRTWNNDAFVHTRRFRYLIKPHRRN